MSRHAPQFAAGNKAMSKRSAITLPNCGSGYAASRERHPSREGASLWLEVMRDRPDPLHKSNWRQFRHASTCRKGDSVETLSPLTNLRFLKLASAVQPSAENQTAAEQRKAQQTN